MPSESRCDTAGRPACPRCGSSDTELSSTVAEERLRNLVATHWAQDPGPRGPDGMLLRGAFAAWAGSLGFWLVAPDRFRVGAWGWAGLLAGLVLAGGWGDRRAARKRGWIDPMKRGEQIAAQARAAPAPVAGEYTCSRCHHRFASAETERSSVA